MIFGILLLILFLSGYYKTTFYKSLEEQAIELDEIGNDIEHASKYSSVFVGQKFCILFATDVHVIRLSDIVFMYSDDYVIKDKAWEETTRYSEIVIYDRKKVKYCCIVKKKKDADNILTDIFKMVPYVINGYSDYRFDMLENDFNGMLFDVDYNKEHMMNGWDKYENNSIS